MAHITTAGASNWRALFEGRPGLAVTPENYDRLLAGQEAARETPVAAPEPAPEAPAEPEAPEVPEPVSEAPAAPRTPPRRPPVAEDAPEGDA